MNEHAPDFIDADVSPSALGLTTLKQSVASDPKGSAWVSANAGSGKTHVLTQRVIRLMLSGSRPSTILCLTYTKAAASEMSNRVFERLSHWATMPDEELIREIYQIEGVTPDNKRLNEAKRLFARALETPGGLKIQTIHGFCESLLHQFPLEANVAGHFNVLDDVGSSSLLAEARRSLLINISTGEDGALAAAFGHALALADDTGLEMLIGNIIAKRSEIGAFIRRAAVNGGIEAILRNGLGISSQENLADIEARFWPIPSLQNETLTTYCALGEAKGGSKVVGTIVQFRAVIAEKDASRRIALLKAIFLTLAGKGRADSSFFSTAMLDANPLLADLFAFARAHIEGLLDKLAIFRMFEATRSALSLAERLLGDYDDLKKHRSLLDFDDLIERTAGLLQKPDIGPWIHYKLDQGIDHILVDEAQDTSPRQWQIIQSLAGDFFSGDSARRLQRTLFAVGDEKQSIYSFQGARPERFAQERSATQKRVVESGAMFSPVQLPLSFRSTVDVLSAVDRVFSFAENAKGLTADGEAVIHESNRIGQAGCVDIWQVIAPMAGNDADPDWTAPYDALNEKAPATILATRIAATIEAMVGQQSITDKNGPRRIEAGDILVLVRKRDAFVGALTRTLKSRGNIAVAGADRLMLATHIAVQDLMALGRFVLLPGDDLSLAALVKSPLLGLGEDDLFTLTATRAAEETVWQHLVRLSTADPKWGSVKTLLESWVRLSKSHRVHDFYAHILATGGGRKMFLARLGNEVSDILDEFLSFALHHETSGLPGLQSFIATLETDAPMLKRELDKGRNEVRIMTVHAAKGLEAPVVFLVDGGSAAYSHTHVSKLRLLENNDNIPAWLAFKELSNSLKKADDERIKALTEDEYRRLLYVGMTRAADRLIVCGYRGKKRMPDTWHLMVTDALTTDATRANPKTFSAGDLIWEGHEWRVGEGLPSSEALMAPTPAATAPMAGELFVPLPPETHLPRPLSPSGAHHVIENDAGDFTVASALFGTDAGAGNAARKGKIIHRLLQVLPGFAPDERRKKAIQYLERAASSWPLGEREKLLDLVFSVMHHPAVTPLFESHSRAEVSIMGTLTLGERQHAITGRIDRLAVTKDCVFIADFKTNRSPPTISADIPSAHIAQLALYREILKPLYPGRILRSMLIYTQSPNLFELSPAQMQEALSMISSESH